MQCCILIEPYEAEPHQVYLNLIKLEILFWGGLICTTTTTDMIPDEARQRRQGVDHSRFWRSSHKEEGIQAHGNTAISAPTLVHQHYVAVS